MTFKIVRTARAADDTACGMCFLENAAEKASLPDEKRHRFAMMHRQMFGGWPKGYTPPDGVEELVDRQAEK